MEERGRVDEGGSVKKREEVKERGGGRERRWKREEVEERGGGRERRWRERRWKREEVE